MSKFRDLHSPNLGPTFIKQNMKNMKQISNIVLPKFETIEIENNKTHVRNVISPPKRFEKQRL